LHDPERVQTVEDFVEFVRRLSADQSPEWEERRATAEFLEAMAAWVEDSWVGEGAPMHGIPRPDPPSWSAFAQALLGATVYE
jgi:hypothetical protein